VIPDRRPTEDPRSKRGGRHLVIGGIIAAVLLIAIMLLLAGEPDPQLGDSLPNAPPQGSEAVK
jgi:hypothetical protein